MFLQREESRPLESSDFRPIRICPDNMPDVNKRYGRARIPDRRLTFEDMTAERFSRFAWMTVGATLVGTCYGGLHLVAWETPFASRTEAILWRAASVTIMAAGPFFALLVAYDQIIRRLYRRYGPVRPARWISDPICQCYVETAIYMLERILIGVDDIPSIARVLGPSITWYNFCRVFIVVESFIMLAHISDLALQVPAWSAYIPHIV
jgi:hypothetical protein